MRPGWTFEQRAAAHYSRAYPSGWQACADRVAGGWVGGALSPSLRYFAGSTVHADAVAAMIDAEDLKARVSRYGRNC